MELAADRKVGPRKPTRTRPTTEKCGQLTVDWDAICAEVQAEVASEQGAEWSDKFGAALCVRLM